MDINKHTGWQQALSQSFKNSSFKENPVKTMKYDETFWSMLPFWLMLPFCVVLGGLGMAETSTVFIVSMHKKKKR